jgi:hypothetical protein
MQPHPLITSIIFRPMGYPVATVLLQEDVLSRCSTQKEKLARKRQDTLLTCGS